MISILRFEVQNFKVLIVTIQLDHLSYLIGGISQDDLSQDDLSQDDLSQDD